MRVLLTVLLVLAAIAPASAADLKLLTAGAFKSVALEIIPEFEKRTGHKVTVENDTAGGSRKRVGGGEYFDVVVMPPLVLGPFLGSKLVESSAKPLARVGIGVAVKQGAPVPDISTVDAFKKSLLAARAIAYIDPASGGSSGIYLAKLFEKMGIAAAAQAQDRAGEGRAGRREAGRAARPTSPCSRRASSWPCRARCWSGRSRWTSRTTRLFRRGVAGSRNRAAADALLAALAGSEELPLLKKKGWTALDFIAAR